MKVLIGVDPHKSVNAVAASTALAAASASMGSDLPLRLRWRRLALSTSITEFPAAFRWRASLTP